MNFDGEEVFIFEALNAFKTLDLLFFIDADGIGLSKADNETKQLKHSSKLFRRINP